MKIKRRKFYILSGPPASGKTSFLKNIPEEMTISSDKIRKSLHPIGKTFINGDVKNTSALYSDDNVFKIIELMLDARLKNKQTTFFDSSNISDKERRRYINIAKKYGVESEIIIFNISLEQCLKNNKQKIDPVNEVLILRSMEEFQTDSIFQYRHVYQNMNDTANLIDTHIIDESIKLDIIGDIHGLYDDMEELIKKAGYFIENGLLKHTDKDRKLLFLGDFVDRGIDSIKVLKFVMKAVDSGHYAIIGNHEHKLLNNLQREKPKGSFAVLSTFMDVMKLSDNEISDILNFLKNLDGFFIYKENVFTHAYIGYFHQEISLTECMYGPQDLWKRDVDKEYQELYDQDENKYTLIRGHVKQCSIQRNVYSLENGSAYNGDLMLLELHKCKKYIYKEFIKNTFHQKVDFNFSEYLIDKNISYHIEDLVKKNLINIIDNDLLKLIYLKNHVKISDIQKNSLLLKANGLVLDLAGNIIQHPIDQLQNYQDCKNLIKDDEIVQLIVRKDFRFNITLNPFTQELLITSDNSFVSTSINKELEIKLKKFLKVNNVTLTFDSDDENIENIENIYLIAIRGKNYNDKNWKEEDVQRIAQYLDIKRPIKKSLQFNDVKKDFLKDKTINRMIIERKVNNNFIFFTEIKSAHYLAINFYRKLEELSIQFMFNSPKNFKDKIDIEYNFIIDKLISISTKEDLIKMNKNELLLHFLKDIIYEKLS